MKFADAVDRCHVRSAIYREANPKIRYWINAISPLELRVPLSDQAANDWREYDPRDDDDGSLFMFND